MSTNDYELEQVNRRTITENGVIQVVCGIGQVPIWSSDLKLLPKIEQCDILIVTVCVFVRHLFSFYPFYFDFHSARIIFDVSSGFYLWNINKTTA